ATRNATAGVGRTPTRTASAPAEVSPATTAASSISPLARGSRPTTATGRRERSRSASTRAADAESATASSGVRSSPLASPRTPSVPNRRRALKASALAVLRRLAGLLEAVLLALDDARVAGEEAGLLQRRAVLRVGLDERAGDRQAQRTGLAGGAAALEVGVDVVAVGLLDRDERLPDQLLVQLAREVLLEGPAVEAELARPGDQPDPDHGLLAAADGLDRAVGVDGRDLGQRDVGADLGVVRVGRVGVLGGLGVDRSLLDGLVLGLGGGHGLSLFWRGRVWVRHWATWVISNAAGFCAACGWSGPA